jgi:cell division protein FtsL
MTLKGRHYLMLWLLLFLVVAVGIVARQSSAFNLAKSLRVLREERATLEAKAADYERRIRESSSRRSLGRLAEDLGLHEPADSEITPLVVPRRRDRR